MLFVERTFKSKTRAFILALGMTSMLWQASPAQANFCSDLLSGRVAIELKSKPKGNNQFGLQVFNRATLIGKMLDNVAQILKKPFQFNTLGFVLHQLETRDLSKPYFGELSRSFDLKPRNLGRAFANLKKDTPLIAYANHPLSGADAFAIAAELEKVRPDIKVVATSFLGNLPGFRDHAFIVNNNNTPEAKIANKVILNQINEHLKNKGSILIFPAGAISNWSAENEMYALDLPWKGGIVRFAEQAPNTTLVPIFVGGEPSEDYLKFRKKHPKLSPALLFKELARQVSQTMNLTVGEDIEFNSILNLDQNEKISYLRAKLYEMGTADFRAKWGLRPSPYELQGATGYPLLTPDEVKILQRHDQRALPQE